MQSQVSGRTVLQSRDRLLASFLSNSLKPGVASSDRAEEDDDRLCPGCGNRGKVDDQRQQTMSAAG